MKNLKTINIIFLMILCTLFTSLGQVFYKLGANNFSFNLLDIIKNYWLILGLFFYFLGAFLLIIALKNAELSIVYPMISLSFLWVSLISKFYLNEKLYFNKILGMISIVSGIVFIGLGSRK
jgi:drug/metabolite transporter (DMT)-like permease